MRVGILILALLFGMFYCATAQRSGQKTIYLKDGSILKGQVVEDNEYFVRLVINTGDTIKVGYKNIVTDDSITGRNRKEPNYYRAQKFFWNINLRGQIEKEEGAGELLAHFGLRLNEHWNVAMGIGVLGRTEEVNFNVISPSYFHLSPYGRYYLKLSKPRIYLSTSAGYSFSITENSFLFLSESHKGGFVANASAGIHFASRSKIRWLIDVGVSYQDTSGELVEGDPWVGEVTTKYSNQYVRPTLGITLEF